ncbi:tRNA pseudouridine synthase A [Ricinus communis]|uniref:tRNA pseudouridine synthase A n=1 Tax=Ricinus communis TaxID=3988 RepID=UPI00201AA4FA|nr:tRNA pseudouridine synthase A [Ricinus communis]
MENSDLKITSPPPQEEPERKRPRMSTTTSDEEEIATTAPGDETATVKKQRYKRRKMAIFFAYCGVGYQGMQKNPGAKTIEGDLEEALFHSGAVPEQDRGCPKRYDWARSARTDKGVSAVGQVISGRFYVDPPGLVDRLNSILPSQIRIFGYKRVTASFNAKKFCDRRRYVYLIPVFALDPSSHRDRESVLASLGSGDELVKCLECSERGRKVIGAVGKRSFESKSEAFQTDILLNGGCAIANCEIKEDISMSMDNAHGVRMHSEFVEQTNVSHNEDSETESAMPRTDILSNSEDGNVKSDSKQEEVMVSEDAADGGNKESETMEKDSKASVGEERVNGEEHVMKGSEFCYGEEEKEKFNRILKYYVGSHNFHNFTTRTKAEDPSAQRYIISFDARTTVTVEGIEFVKCEVIGQSFMLHQIRKMIGLAVAIMRNCAPESLISTALQKDVKINVPTAPEVGLYLDECFFTSYNQKWKDHEELCMKDYEEVAEDFKMKYIYSHIASTEQKEGVVGLWLHSLNYRNYPDLRFCYTLDANNEKSTEVVNNGDANSEESAQEKNSEDADVEKNGKVENMVQESRALISHC